MGEMVEIGSNRAADAEPADSIGGGEIPRGDSLSQALSARIDALVKDNQVLTRHLDGERHEKARLLSAVSRLQGENAALREALAPAHAMSDEVAQLGARLDVLTQHLDSLPSRLGSAARGPEGSNQAAEQLHAILTSRSWRAMRPLRGLGRLVRRLRA